MSKMREYNEVYRQYYRSKTSVKMHRHHNGWRAKNKKSTIDLQLASMGPGYIKSN